MTVYRVVCKEEVSTEFYVEAENKVELSDWLSGESESAPDGETSADVVSNMTERQTVQDREFVIYEAWPKDAPPADFNLTLLPAPKRGDSDCVEKKEKS